MFRLFVLAIVTLTLGCGGGHKTDVRPESISLSKLVRYYRDNDSTYTDRKIEVVLIGTSYTCVEGEGIYWYQNDIRQWPTVVFVCHPPSSNLSTLTVVGTCKGFIRDGHDRKSGVDFYIRVEDCSVTARQ